MLMSVVFRMARAMKGGFVLIVVSLHDYTAGRDGDGVIVCG